MPNLDDPLRSDRVGFADERAVHPEPFHAERTERGSLSQARVERKINVGEAGHVAARAARRVDARAFDVTEVADVVGGPVGALDDRGAVLGFGQKHVVVGKWDRTSLPSRRAPLETHRKRGRTGRTAEDRVFVGRDGKTRSRRRRKGRGSGARGFRNPRGACARCREGRSRRRRRRCPRFPAEAWCRSRGSPETFWSTPSIASIVLSTRGEQAS